MTWCCISRNTANAAHAVHIKLLQTALTAIILLVMRPDNPDLLKHTLLPQFTTFEFSPCCLEDIKCHVCSDNLLDSATFLLDLHVMGPVRQTFEPLYSCSPAQTERSQLQTAADLIDLTLYLRHRTPTSHATESFTGSGINPQMWSADITHACYSRPYLIMHCCTRQVHVLSVCVIMQYLVRVNDEVALHGQLLHFASCITCILCYAGYAYGMLLSLIGC